MGSARRRVFPSAVPTVRVPSAESASAPLSRPAVTATLNLPAVGRSSRRTRVVSIAADANTATVRAACAAYDSQ
ncbi:MAG: hypothetical protein R3A52_27160 [Polyangiales bacterium]